MAKFEEAKNRLFKGVYVCRVCKSKIKAPPMKVIAKTIKCRRCNNKILRPIKSKK